MPTRRFIHSDRKRRLNRKEEERIKEDMRELEEEESRSKGGQEDEKERPGLQSKK